MAATFFLSLTALISLPAQFSEKRRADEPKRLDSPAIFTEGMKHRDRGDRVAVFLADRDGETIWILIASVLQIRSDDVVLDWGPDDRQHRVVPEAAKSVVAKYGRESLGIKAVNQKLMWRLIPEMKYASKIYFPNAKSGKQLVELDGVYFELLDVLDVEHEKPQLVKLGDRKLSELKDALVEIPGSFVHEETSPRFIGGRDGSPSGVKIRYGPSGSLNYSWEIPNIIYDPTEVIVEFEKGVSVMNGIARKRFTVTMTNAKKEKKSGSGWFNVNDKGEWRGGKFGFAPIADQVKSPPNR